MLFSSVSLGQSETNSTEVSKKNKPVTVPKISNAPLIDGNLDEEIWKSAAVFKDFIQTNPGDNLSPSKLTEVYMIYDEKNLYIAFKCWDERDKIRATVAKRDGIIDEDNVRVWLDTYNDGQRAYVLGWNPLGIQYDGIYTEEQGADLSVDILMESKGTIEDWGWSVEAKIPFKSIRYQAGEGKLWGFHAGRNIERLNNEFDSWMPHNRNINGFLIQSGKITGFDDIKTERTLEIIPSVTLSETGKRVSDVTTSAGRFVNEPIKQDYGLNLKYTITPNVTLDMAINPDFAEIEADASVVTANQRFPIFFEEKRPFFQEGTEIFQSPIRVFNSRSIIDPDFAAKLTGKIGKNSFGFLVASDKAPGNFDENSRLDPNRRPFIDEFIDENANFAVLRLKRDVGRENSIGFFGTARVFPEERNFTAGFDGRIKVNQKAVFQYQIIASTSRRCFFEPNFDDVTNPTQAERNGQICGGGIVNGAQVLGDKFSRYRTGNGFAYLGNYDYTTDIFGYTFGFDGQSKDYRADAGFVRRTDTHNFFFRTRNSTKSKPKNSIIRASWFNHINLGFDGKGRLQVINGNTSANVSLQKNTSFGVFTGIENARLYENEFGLARNETRKGAFFGEDFRSEVQPFIGTSFRSQPAKRFNFDANFTYVYNSFDLDFGAGRRFPRVSPAAINNPNAPLDPGGGKRFEVGAGIELLPIDPLSVSFEYDKIQLVRNETNKTAFDVNIFSLRSRYQFTRFLFTRLRIDYNTLRSNVRGRFLFGWNPNPGTAVYLGYNDDLNYNGFSQYTGNLEPNFQRNSRTFFIRMSYLFRKSF